MVVRYRVTGPVVKVSIGTLEGNRVPWILRSGGIVPAGVDRQVLESLEDRGLIEKVTVEQEPEPDSTYEVPEADSPEDEQQTVEASPAPRRAAAKK